MVDFLRIPVPCAPGAIVLVPFGGGGSLLCFVGGGGGGMKFDPALAYQCDLISLRTQSALRRQ